MRTLTYPIKVTQPYKDRLYFSEAEGFCSSWGITLYDVLFQQEGHIFNSVVFSISEGEQPILPQPFTKETNHIITIEVEQS